MKHLESELVRDDPLMAVLGEREAVLFKCGGLPTSIIYRQIPRLS